MAIAVDMTDVLVFLTRVMMAERHMMSCFVAFGDLDSDLVIVTCRL